MSRLCYEHDVCLSVGNVDGLLSYSGTKSGNLIMIRKFDVCYLHAEADQDRNIRYITLAASDDSHVALSQHLLNFLFLCASCKVL